MQRREFLYVTGAAAIAKATPVTQATVLYDDRTVTLDKTQLDARNSLWVRKSDLPRINDFQIKPEGACRADMCIPISKDMAHGDYFNLTAFAKKVRESVVVDSPSRVWSFGEIPAVRGSFLNSRMAPAVTVPDRKGRPVNLSDFRGKKVLLFTWASW
jgi:hypothetical protein